MPLLETHTYISQLFWLIISFTLLYFLLSKFCIPQLTKILELRDSKINGALEKARILQEEAVALREDYESKLSKATIAKNIMLNKAMEEISANIDTKNIKSEQKFSKMLLDAEKKLEDFANDSQDSITEIAKETTKSILKDFLKIKISDTAINKSLKDAKTESGDIHDTL
jgi:F-type H+-transporting ATPase subunit b